ncbi:hypothetical protein P1S61_30105 [Streptomyces sp. ME08-AFT2]|uniref:hypothetical protein n=1 Tax=Streptomyces TaxID=1883 RepID=UPI0029B471DE|nr:MULTISPECIES: hypothetical protein [Streptomyces]MDX3313254.1 hypothetical protein [Streptomyces sp. ME08-AFT2]
MSTEYEAEDAHVRPQLTTDVRHGLPAADAAVQVAEIEMVWVDTRKIEALKEFDERLPEQRLVVDATACKERPPDPVEFGE